MDTIQPVLISPASLFDPDFSNSSLYIESPEPSYGNSETNLPRVVPLLVIVSALWLAWRLWTFTLLPRIFPHKPKIYPYCIPWLGHSLSFVFNADKILDRARNHFGNTRTPFSFVLGGKTVHVITSARDTTAVFRNPTQLTFNTYVQDMLLRFGISKHGVDTIWHEPTPPSGRGPCKPKSLFKKMESIMKVQLTSGDEMRNLQESLLHHINQNLSWDTVPDRGSTDRKDNEKVVSLHDWTRQCLLRNTTLAFYGKAIFEAEPDILEIFSDFDSNSWKLPYRVPAMFSKNMNEPKEAAQRAFKKYFDLPKSKRADACWMVQAVEEEMHASGLQYDDISKFLLMVYWGVNTNTWKAAFWMITNIVSNESLSRSIYNEILPFTQADPPLSPVELQAKLETCSLLTATYHETLRLYTSSTAARDVSSECILDGLVLEKDSRLLIPYRQMLLDEQVFGEDAAQFNPDRFLQKPTLVSHPSFRPFGGGLAYCPGRFIAQKEITYFNAGILSNFRLELLDHKSNLPTINKQKPCSGVVEVAPGQHVLLKVRQRV